MMRCAALRWNFSSDLLLCDYLGAQIAIYLYYPSVHLFIYSSIHTTLRIPLQINATRFYVWTCLLLANGSLQSYGSCMAQSKFRRYG
jgi:hypothetical protein